MITLNPPKKKSLSIVGAGWLGLQLLTHFSEPVYELKASTTNADKLLSISETDAEAFLIHLPCNIPASFLDSDVLIITLPPPRVQDAVLFHVEQLKSFMDFKGHVIYTSSISVYGSPDSLTNVSESSVLNPETESAKVVIAAENYLRSIFGERLTILRLGGLIGHDRKPGRFLAGRSGLPEAESPVNLVTGEDVVKAIFRTVELEVFGHTMNIVADEHPTRKEYYSNQALNMGLPLPQFDEVNHPVSGKIVENTLSKTLLGISYSTINI